MSARSVDDTATDLRRIVDKMDRMLPCTATAELHDGNRCRPHYDSELCPSCSIVLELDRLHRALCGGWMHEVATGPS